MRPYSPFFEKSKIVYEGVQLIRPYPVNIQVGDEKFFDSLKTGWSREVAFGQFRKVTINNELFIKKQNRLHIEMESFGDVWQDKRYNSFLYQAKSFTKNLLRKNKSIDSVLWCFDQFSTGGYFHWITEIAPRLWIALQHIDKNLPLLIPQYFLERWPFAQAFLDPFKRPIQSFHVSEVITIDRMAFITQTGGPLNYQSIPIKASTQYLLEYYLPVSEFNSNTQRVYISRKNSGKRMLLNENEILPILEEYKYSVIYAENLTLIDQIKLFSNATHLVSIHGAGLSNMAFMPEGSTVLEIRHKDENHMLNCFYTLAHTFGHHYYYCFGYDKGDSLKSEIRPEDKSIHVDVQMLRSILRRLHC